MALNFRNRFAFLDKNRVPCKYMDIFSPKISYVKVWGGLCYATINGKGLQRYKFPLLSLKSILVCYCESTTQYRAYFLSKGGWNKVLASTNLRFLEDKLWAWKKSSLSKFDDQSSGLLENQHPCTPINFDFSFISSSESSSGTEKFPRDCPTRVLGISQTYYVLDKIGSFDLTDAEPWTSPLEGYDAILPNWNEEP